MRLAYLHSGSIPSVYANGVHVMRMCDAFTEAGHEVTLYALPGSVHADDVYDYYGVRHRFPIRTIGAPTRIALLGMGIRALRIRADIRRRGRPDLAYGRDLYSLAAVSDLGPLVYETHMLWDNRVWRWLERRLFRARTLQQVVTVSTILADDYRRAFPELNGLDLLVAPDGADPPKLAGPTMRLPGRAEAAKIGYVGHLYPGRGIDVILDLAGRLPDLDFHLVGGTTEDRSHWESRSRHPNVYFHGHQPPGTLGSYYRSFEIVLAPYQTKVACAGGIGDISRWTSPMKLFEYMSQGRAIIASDLPVLREVLTDRVNCLLCPPADLSAWAVAITELATDQELRRSLGTEAQRQLLTRYTWRQRVDRVLP